MTRKIPKGHEANVSAPSSKDGGRESGPAVRSGSPEAVRSVAANPAACPDCETFRTIVDPVPSHVHWCHERIRELEDRILAIGKAYASADWHLRQVSELLYTEEAGA